MEQSKSQSVSQYVTLDENFDPGLYINSHLIALYKQIIENKKSTTISNELEKFSDFKKSIKITLKELKKVERLARFFQWRYLPSLQQSISYMNELEIRLESTTENQIKIENSVTGFLVKHYTSIYKRSGEKITSSKWADIILSKWQELRLIKTLSDDEQIVLTQKLQRRYENCKSEKYRKIKPKKRKKKLRK
ncbi:MAG: hypothetical protein H6623_02705 [Bdellovibrionaceae bacterium]|nr:hypothetical protein [Pseudobdellovibrionaceae bacterium]